MRETKGGETNYVYIIHVAIIQIVPRVLITL